MWCAPMGLGGEPSSDAEFALRRMRSRKSRTVMLGRGPSVYWASLEPGEDLGAVEELEELHGVRMQSDDGVVIIGGFGDFFLSRIAVELSFFPCYLITFCAFEGVLVPRLGCPILWYPTEVYVQSYYLVRRLKKSYA